MNNAEIKKAIEEYKKIKKCGLYAIMYCNTRTGEIWTKEYADIWTKEYADYWSYTHYDDSAIINVTAYMWEWELPLTVKGVRKCLTNWRKENPADKVIYINLGSDYERKDGNSTASTKIAQWLFDHPEVELVESSADFRRDYRDAKARYVFMCYPYVDNYWPRQKAVYAKAVEL